MRERRRDAWVVLLVALVARLALVAWGHARFPAVEDGHYYDVLARRLASGAGYTWLWPDGAVTFAAHYPVGYPAMLAAAYAVVGPSVGAAMTINAVVGAFGAYAAHRLVDVTAAARWRPLGAGLAVALHPALLPYTAAPMTEAVTASLCMLAAAAAERARRSADTRGRWLVCTGVLTGIGTLVRPQTLAIAPLMGVLCAGRSALRAKLTLALAVSLVALGCVAPWTIRNCVRMDRCALVSVNEGWNLLIGATTTTGGWEPVTVPAECAAVWSEASKDTCFERAAAREIAHAPFAWLARVPSKLAMTFDYFGAGPWYLHASAPGVFGDRAKAALGGVETVVCRVLLLAALVVCGRCAGESANARKVVALVGAAAALTLHGYIGYLSLVVCVALRGRRALEDGSILAPSTAGVIATTACVHAVFFGAGRYGLVVAPFVAALAFAQPASE